MKPDQPSLNALRAFESAARRGSFVLAAVELGVSAAAISQLVRGLESDMRRQLFLRQGNRLLLTDAGREIYPALETAFREIASIAPLGEVGPRDKRLILSALPWLAPWALGVLADYPAAVEIRVEPDPVALTEGAADLRLSYGGALYPDHKVVPLYADQMVIVQARPGPLVDAPRITVHWGAAYASLPGWALWHAQNGLLPPAAAKGLAVNDPHLALLAVRQGQGAALVPQIVAAAAPDLHQTAAGFTLPWPYALVHLNARARHRPLAALVSHLYAKATGQPALAHAVTPG
jgi:LysR family glycine cleavage system transcriptional activator